MQRRPAEPGVHLPFTIVTCAFPPLDIGGLRPIVQTRRAIPRGSPYPSTGSRAVRTRTPRVAGRRTVRRAGWTCRARPEACFDSRVCRLPLSAHVLALEFPLAPEEEDINRQPIIEMEIDSLRLSGSPRLAGVDPVHVEAIGAMQGELPPIVVHRPTMRVIDGAHRIQAALRRGDSTIAGRFFKGSEDDAFVLSVWLNVSHGLPLALADRKRAAVRIAVSHPQWSDRRVAAVTGISPGTVADIRKRAPGPSAPDSRRIGQDGRLR